MVLPIFGGVRPYFKARDREGNISFDKLSRADFVMNILKYIEIHDWENAWIIYTKEAKSFTRKIVNEEINSIKLRYAYIVLR